ncbi:MAG: class I SAM-dependent methyltransferase [Planctomycetota bacterium]
MTATTLECPVCKGTDFAPMYALGNEGEYRYHRCKRCKLVVYDMENGLDQAKYAVHWADPREENPAFAKVDQTYEFIVRAGLPVGRLLDIGAGSGRILARAQRDGWDVVGIELSESLAEQTTAALGAPVHAMNFLDGDIEPLGKFDLVVLAHVLEHLPDPVLAMDRIGSLLEDGGHAIFEFPNIDALDLRLKRVLSATGIHRKRYPDGWQPGHCQEFCRESFAFLADRTGFEMVHWETYSSKPAKSGLYRALGVGSKARVLVRRRPR